MTKRYDVVIVGAGHGGAQAAMALRAQHFVGTIAVVGDEPELPYERPPLSKDYLAGEKSWEKLLFRSAASWAEREIEILLGRSVVSVDPDRHVIGLADGAIIAYGTLIWATGGAPRRLTCSGHDLAGMHTVRSRADVDRLVAELPGASDAVVVGGGYIGLESAAVLRKLEKRVTLVETLDRVLARVAGETLSRFYEAEHRAHGVDVRLGIGVDCVLEDSGRVSGVRLTDGEVLPAQMVIVGIGIVPAVAPLATAGAECTNGVRVDGQCRTSLPDVFAIGDCAEHRSRYACDRWVRVESVQNAHDQAAVVSKVLSGSEAIYDAVPWFWSNQYDLKLQTVGLSQGYDQSIVRGDPANRAFSVLYLREGTVVALDCVNSVRDYVQGRALVLNGARPDPTKVCDRSIPLKELSV